MNLDHAPLNIAVSILEVGISVELSWTAYFDDFETIPKWPFLLVNSNIIAENSEN